MTTNELETAYTAVANAIQEVGPDNAQLMLATLCLQLMSEQENAAPVFKAIEQAIQLSKQ